jgi:cytochrome c556
MKTKTMLPLLFAVTALVVGCNKEPSTAQQIENIKAETKEAAHDMKDYTFAQKAEFAEHMKHQLAEINRDLEQLAAKIEKSSDDAKAKAKPKFQALRDQEAELKHQLEKVQDATESTWSDVKAAFKKGCNEMKDGFQDARQWVSDKIAP